MYTITVGGPTPKAEDARHALIAAGFDVRATEIEQDAARVIVQGEDINAAHSAVEPCGWRLQQHALVIEDAVMRTATERALDLAGYQEN